jgi:hypothetical protein
VSQSQRIAKWLASLLLGTLVRNYVSPSWRLLVVGGLLALWWAERETPWFKRMSGRLRQLVPRRRPVAIGMADLERQESTGVYRTEEQVRELFDFPAARRATNRRDFVKDELGSYNPVEREALNFILTRGQVSEIQLREYLESRGHQLTTSVMEKLAPLVAHNFAGNFSVKEELKSDVLDVLG